jgi:hypothetical protein
VAQRARMVLEDLYRGFKEGYRPCCVLRFSLSMVRYNQATRRGVMFPWTPRAHVPCGVFHKGMRWVDVVAAES